MNKTIAILLILSLLAFSKLFAQEERITNEQIYRELKVFMAKTEERFNSIDQRFEDVDKRFNDFNERFRSIIKLLGILSGIFALMLVTCIGLIFWDRKTFIERSVKKSVEKIESEGLLIKLLNVLKEISKEDKKVAMALKEFNLL